jgi:hypothetical protein
VKRAIVLLTVVLAGATLTATVFGAGVKAPVVLGKKHLLSYGIGWGTSHPRLIFNGGDPSGQARHLVWRHWGAATAYARGMASIPRPGGNYYAKPGVIELRAFRLGRCTPRGPRAYTRLQAREAKRPGGARSRWSPGAGGRASARRRS